MRVAFLGLGAMGQGMVRNLLRAGHEVSIWNRTPERAAPLAAEGARAARSIAEAVQDAEVASTMVADDPALDAIVDGTTDEPGLLASLAHGAIHVAHSTISTEMSRALARRHADAGQQFVSAPVFGRPDAAAAARLTIVAAGPAGAVERVRPLLDALGQKVFVVGDDAPMANVVKLGGNFLIASMIETLGEAFALMRKSGVEPAQFLEIVNGNLFRSPVYENYGGIIAGERFDPPGFTLRLGLKDVRLVLAASEQAGTPMPVASVIRDRLISAIAHGKGDLDWSALASMAADAAGLSRG